MGNNGSTIDIRCGRFALNMRFVVEQLHRVHKPGTNCCIHIQQLLAYKNQHGFIGRRDFRGAMIDVFSAGGFHFAGEFALQKNPQAMAQRINLHSLMFVTGKRNANNLAPCPNDYVLIFHKPGECVSPVRALYDSRINPGGWISSEEWIRDAHGIWTDVLEIDVLDGARQARETDTEKHVCLARGSLVLTRDGHKPIETVEVGDLVLTHNGRWRPVTAVACNGKREVVRTVAQGVPDLCTTPDHLLWVRSSTGSGRWPGSRGGTSHPRVMARRNSPEWIPASETKGSYVNLPLPPVEDSRLSAEDWWLIGRWLGDGHLDTRGRPHISCAHDEADELITAMGRRAGFTAVRETATQVAIKDRCGQHSTEFTTILKRCGRGAAGKRLPVEALSLNPELARSLLDGYLSADGHFVEKYQRSTASSVSRALLLGMAMIAQRAMGVVASVYAGRPAGTCVIQGRTVNTRQDWILSIPPRNVSGMILPDGAWKKVRSVDSVGESEVWDIQVEEDHSFVAEGCVVHNCPLQLEVIRRLVRLYSNPAIVQPDVLVLDPFMGIGSTAWVCLDAPSPTTRLVAGGQRHVVGFELKESYHRNAIRNISQARKLVEAMAKEESLLF